MMIWTYFAILFIVVLLILPMICYFIRCESKTLSRLGPRQTNHRRNANFYQHRAEQMYRQGNIFTISDDAALNNNSGRYPEFFYYEENGVDAVRLRAQFEKDDKDLPSYDEVMRCTTMLTPTAAPANISDIPGDIRLTVPPYSETDPLATVAQSTPATPPINSPSTTQSMQSSAPSTSRAAADAAILNSVRNV